MTVYNKAKEESIIRFYHKQFSVYLLLFTKQVMTFSLIYVRAFTKLLYELHDVSTRNSSELFQAKETLAINSLAL